MKKPTPIRNFGDVEQTFRLETAGARSVMLAADFTQWQEQAVPMKPMADGVWSVSVGLSPGTYQYRFVVDGEWRDDPQCTHRVPNVFGGQNMVREVSPTAAPSRIRSQRPIVRKVPAARRNKPLRPQPIVL